MIYFDNSATTFVDPKVLETFNKVCTEYPGNSNSIHSLGVKSKELEEYATEKIARMLNLVILSIHQEHQNLIILF